MGLAITKDEVAKLVESATDLALQAVERELHKHLPDIVEPLVDMALHAAGKVIDKEVENLAGAVLARWMEPR